jgi:hypothetical protein
VIEGAHRRARKYLFQRFQVNSGFEEEQMQNYRTGLGAKVQQEK